VRYASLRQGLVGAWCPSVSGPYGYRLPDLSGYGNHGTLTNMDPGSDWVVSGKGALDFVDGSDDYISIGAADGLRITGNISVSAWVYPRSTNKLAICVHGAGNVAAYGMVYSWLTIKNLTWWNSANGSALNTTDTFDLDRWHHFVGTRGPNGLALYANGIQVASNSSTESGSGDTSGILAFGRFGSFSGYQSSSIIDDIRIYNRPLLQSEIRLLASERGIGLKPERIRNRYSAPATTNTRNRSSRFLGFPA